MGNASKKVDVPRPVPPAFWGKDHFSTLAYLECRATDNAGISNKLHLRVDPKRHPALGHVTWSEDYPTQLKDGVELPKHDDIDVIEDMIAAGLVLWEGTGFSPIFVLTDKGKALAARLRAHKSAGGMFGNFDPGTI